MTGEAPATKSQEENRNFVVCTRQGMVKIVAFGSPGSSTWETCLTLVPQIPPKSCPSRYPKCELSVNPLRLLAEQALSRSRYRLYDYALQQLRSRSVNQHRLRIRLSSKSSERSRICRSCGWPYAASKPIICRIWSYHVLHEPGIRLLAAVMGAGFLLVGKGNCMSWSSQPSLREVGYRGHNELPRAALGSIQTEKNCSSWRSCAHPGWLSHSTLVHSSAYCAGETHNTMATVIIIHQLPH